MVANSESMLHSMWRCDMFETLPCPFCGKNTLATDSEILENVLGGKDEPCTSIRRIWAKCTYCGAQGPKTVQEIIGPDEEMAAAVVAWNRRSA